MLEPFGFVVNLVPGVVEHIVQKALQQAMVAQHLQCALLTSPGQTRTVMFLVIHGRWLLRRQFLQHSRHGSGTNAQMLSECIAGYP